MRIFLFGYYGYGNFGDEILLSCSIELLKKICGDPKIHILLPRKSHPFENNPKVSRLNLPGIVLNILKSDLVVGGGGGIFQDETSLRSFLYYSFIVFTALILRKDVILLCHGIGPLRRKLSRWMMRKILSSRHVYPILRDEVSYRYCRMISKNAVLSVDLLVLKRLETPRKMNRNTGKISMILRKIPKDMEDFTKILASIGVSEIDLLVFFPNMDYGTNRKLQEDLREKFKVRILMNHEDLVESVMTSRFVMTERLHGAILSTLVGTPFISNLRIKKINRFFRDYLGRCDFDDAIDLFDTITKLEDFNFDEYRERKLVDWEKKKKDLMKKLTEILKKVENKR